MLRWAPAPGWTPGEDTGLEARVLAREQPLRTFDDLATCAEEAAAGRTTGVLSLWSGERPYSRADEELLTTVAALLALCLTRPSER